MLYAKINVKSNHFLFLTSLESPLHKGGSEGVWKYRWLLHYDLNGYVIYQKWFDDGKMLKPKFMEIKSCHLITREQVTLLVSNAVQSKMYIYDE